MMAFVRLLVPFGLMAFGAVAAFMGCVVLITSLSSGRFAYSYVSDGKPVIGAVTKDAEPDAYWRALGFGGALPAILGLGAVWYGRRMLHR